MKMRETKAKTIPVNPKLPKNFDCTPNEQRPQSHQRWWYRPYIETYTLDDFGVGDEQSKKSWLAHWPTGIRYDVRCLDGGAWDRSTSYGCFATLDEAMKVAELLQEAIAFVPPGAPTNGEECHRKYMVFHRALKEKRRR